MPYPFQEEASIEQQPFQPRRLPQGTTYMGKNGQAYPSLQESLAAGAQSLPPMAPEQMQTLGGMVAPAMNSAADSFGSLINKAQAVPVNQMQIQSPASTGTYGFNMQGKSTGTPTVTPNQWVGGGANDPVTNADAAMRQRVQQMIQAVNPRTMGLDLSNPDDPFNAAIMRGDVARGQMGDNVLKSMYQNQQAGGRLDLDRQTALMHDALAQGQLGVQQAAEKRQQQIADWTRSPAAMLTMKSGQPGTSASDLDETKKWIEANIGPIHGGAPGGGPPAPIADPTKPAGVSNEDLRSFMIDAFGFAPISDKTTGKVTGYSPTGGTFNENKLIQAIMQNSKFQTQEGAAALAKHMRENGIPGGLPALQRALGYNVIRQGRESGTDLSTLPGLKVTEPGFGGSYNIAGLGDLPSNGLFWKSDYNDFLPTMLPSTKKKYGENVQGISPVLAALLQGGAAK